MNEPNREPMTEDRDPALLALFAEAKNELPDAEFMARTMDNIDRLRRRALVGWSLVGLVLVAVAWLLAAALQDAVLLLTESLNISLVNIDDERVAEFLSPVNTVAGAVAFGFLVVFRFFRKIFA